MSFTLVFDGDIRQFKRNPFKTQTPFGVPVAVSADDAFEEIEKAIAAEREQCAQIAECLNGWGSARKGQERAVELANHIAKVIRRQSSDAESAGAKDGP